MSSIDVNAMVAKLMAVEARPLNQLAAKQKVAQSKIDAFAKLQGGVSSFQTAIEKLGKPDIWAGAKASITGDGLSAAVTDSAKTSVGRYSVVVDKLAVSHAMASKTTYANADAVVGGGKLTLQVGEGESVEIELKDGATLADVRDAINGAKAGVSAGIVMDGDQVRLTLMATNTGAKNAIKLSAAANASAGLSALVGDVGTTRAAGDAEFTVNNLKLTAASNKVTGAIEGVTIDLKKAGADVMQIDITRDAGSMKDALNAFVKAYNDMGSTIKTLTSYDADTRRAGLLNGDSLVRGLQDQMRTALRMNVSGGEFKNLGQIGVEIQKDGTLKINDEKLAKALEKPDELARLFTHKSDSAGEQGLALRFKAIADHMVGDEGLITQRNKSLKTQYDSYTKEADALNVRLNQTEKRLLKQYTALDVQLSAMQNQSVALANALAGLPGYGR
ncbi:MAG: flagellar filament capping protein FliD [Burkholderiaceae bacterium]